MQKSFFGEILAVILALVTVIVLGAMPGDKTVWWTPILIIGIITLILVLLGLIYMFIDSRQEDDGWTPCGLVFEGLVLMAVNGVALLLSIISLIIYIVALKKGGLTSGESHLIENNAKEAEMVDAGVGTCDSLNIESSYFKNNKEKFMEFTTFCFEKNEDHPSEISGLVFIILTAIACILTLVLIIKERDVDGDGGEPLNSGSLGGSFGRQPTTMYAAAKNGTFGGNKSLNNDRQTPSQMI